MKKFYLVSLMVTLPTSAFAMPNLTCAFSGMDNPYLVSFENGNATVTKYLEPVQFGNLLCNDANRLFGLIATCYSPGVADAGFGANLYRDTNNVFTMDLYEESFIGGKLLGTYPCWAN